MQETQADAISRALVQLRLDLHRAATTAQNLVKLVDGNAQLTAQAMAEELQSAARALGNNPLAT
jgi:hypothetical protein